MDYSKKKEKTKEVRKRGGGRNKLLNDGIYCQLQRCNRMFLVSSTYTVRVITPRRDV
jgi:hypothetical protein